MAAILVMFVLVVLSHAEDQMITSYFKVGGNLTLWPSFSGAISSIVWKSKGNLVAEWTKDSVPLTYYSNFNGSTTLNNETGELEINNMGKDESGEYVVEINNVILPQTYEAVEIKEVPKPVVNLRPLTCNPASNSCKLVCDGDIKESGPVTFYWRMGDEGEWKESKQDMDITNDEETKKVLTFSCRMKNPVSVKDSEPEPNPFLLQGGIFEGILEGPSGGSAGGISGGAGRVIFLLTFSFGNLF